LTALGLMRVAQPEAAVREPDVIDRQVRHMMRLVDDLLDLARVARGSVLLHCESVDLRAAAERAVEMASPLLEARQHRLDIEVAEGLRVDVDPVRFSQIIANLLTNAAKFTPPSGQVKVRGYAREREVLLEVEDDGIGIDPSQLELIFDPFVQARRGDETHGGLGLGLSLVRDLVQLHGGSVQAQSAGIGQGSRFTLRLPQGTLDAAISAASPMERASFSPLRVLIVDDNQDSADMLWLLLSGIGHEVRVAYDGPHALALASEFEPNAAVLDISLPVMDGYELATQLRERHGARGLRLLALTGLQERDKVRCLEAGFHRHLTKPIHPREIEAALVE
jgi:CheY-like chemotaxis protein/two-component sensor histidine kinase